MELGNAVPRGMSVRSGRHHGAMPSSSRLSLEYLIDAIAELQLGSVARLRALEKDLDIEKSSRAWKTEQPVWRRQRERVGTVAQALLAAELDALTAAPDHPLPSPDELLSALVGAARCRRLDSGASASAEDAFSS